MTIEKAFAEVPQPAAEDLCASKGDEALEDTAPFRGKKWQELSSDVLDMHQYALFWFTPQAFHYYLPAFLAAGSKTPDALYVITLLQLLRSTSDQTLARFRAERWSMLTEEQIGVLEDWLARLLNLAMPGTVFEEEVKESLQYVRERGW